MKKAVKILLLSALFCTFTVTKQVNAMQDTQEIWKDVVGYEGLYKVSSIGRIKSISRNGTIKADKIISAQLVKGYYNIKLCKNDVPIRHSVHRLMGFAFMMETYFEGAQINHINGIKTDNRIPNFKWVTPAENVRHAWDNNLCTPARYWLGKIGHRSKPVIQLDLDNKIVNEFISATIASRETGISRQHISHCCVGNRTFAGGFKWKHK